MKLEIIQTVTGKYQIVDQSSFRSDDTPLIGFHNECSTREIAERVMRTLVDYYAEKELKGGD